MKETASIISFFLFLGLYSGAMSLLATIIFIFIAGLLIFLAWTEEKKDKIIKKELLKLRRERLARQG